MTETNPAPIGQGPTLTDVAKHAELSLSTVSRAFSRPSQVSAGTLSKVMYAANELGYVAPRRAGERPDGGETARGTVAVVLPDIVNPMFASFVRSAQRQGWHSHTAVIVADTAFDRARERELLTHLSGRVDGIVLCSSRLHGPDIAKAIGRLPHVLVNREVDGSHCLITDGSQGLRQTVDYLSALGHRRIAYVQGSPESWSNAHRAEALRALAAEYGLDLDVLDWQTETVEGGIAVAARVMASEATAVITHNDLVGLGLVAAARSLGVKVPEDVSVVGIDNIPFASLPQISMSSINIPMERAGVRAMEILQRLIAGSGEKPTVETLPTHLVVRGSSGPARVRTQPRGEASPS